MQAAFPGLWPSPITWIKEPQQQNQLTANVQYNLIMMGAWSGDHTAKGGCKLVAGGGCEATALDGVPCHGIWVAFEQQAKSVKIA